MNLCNLKLGQSTILGGNLATLQEVKDFVKFCKEVTPPNDEYFRGMYNAFEVLDCTFDGREGEFAPYLESMTLGQVVVIKANPISDSKEFSKNDMVSAIVKKLKGKFNKNFAAIPIGEGYTLVLQRGVFRKAASWEPLSLYYGQEEVHKFRHVKFAEKEEFVDLLLKLQKYNKGKEKTALFTSLESDLLKKSPLYNL